jgi:hypothetical protein
MKRGTPGHPKVYDLAERLEAPRPMIIGYLELLWHFTAVYAPHGDIGRLTDQRIEKAVDWNGESGRLVAALIEAGWVDRDAEHRLIVHDWEEHCDDAVRKKVARSGQRFLRVSSQDAMSGQTVRPASNTIPDKMSDDSDLAAGQSVREMPTGSPEIPDRQGDNVRRNVRLARARMPEPEPEPVPLPEPEPEPVLVPVPHASGVPRATASDRRESAPGAINGPGAATTAAPAESKHAKPDKAIRELIAELQGQHIEPGNARKAEQAALKSQAEWGGAPGKNFASFVRRSFAAWLPVWRARREREPTCFVPQVAVWFESGDWLVKPTAESRRQNGRKPSKTEFLERVARGEIDLAGRALR